MKNILFYVVATLMLGCNSNTIDHKVKELLGQNLNIPDSIIFLANGTSYTKEYFNNAEFKIINYIDTSGCEECKLHLFDWGKLQRGLDTLNQEVKVCFIIWSKDIDNILKLSRIHRFNYPIMYDSLGLFARDNDIPLISGFQTCLVDSCNSVIGVGSPLYNKALLDLYMNQVTK